MNERAQGYGPIVVESAWQNRRVPLFPDQLGDETLALGVFSLAYLHDAPGAVEESRPAIQKWPWRVREPLGAETYGASILRPVENFVNVYEWRCFVVDCSTGGLVVPARIDVTDFEGSKSANVGDWVRSSCTEKNVATRTIRIRTDVAFQRPREVGIVEIGMDVVNVASARISKKPSFTCWGKFDKDVRASRYNRRGLIRAPCRSNATQILEKCDEPDERQTKGATTHD